MSIYRFLTAAVAAGLLALTAFGQLDGNPENFCRNGFFPRESENYRLAQVAGGRGARVHFYADDRENCPAADGCRTKSYVVPGDEVIVSRTFDEFACVWFQPAAGSETVGWVRTRELRYKPVKTLSKPAEWLGEWSFYDNSIVISPDRRAGFLRIRGEAFWQGLGDNVHIGELDYAARPAGGRLRFGGDETDEYACRVRLRLLGRYLIAADNLNCGGANVTFSGVYRRTKR